MSKVFTRTFRVRWGELDASGTVSPANYLHYLIETAWDWGAAVGWGLNYSQNPDVFWVIRETEVRFFHPLRYNDVFDFTIWMVSWQKVRGTRCVELKFKESGDVIAQGTQQIVYMDAATGRPLNLPEEEIEKFRLENPRVFPFERFPKITPVETPFTVQRRVESMDLDAYEHVNNAVYIRYAEEAALQDQSSRGWPPAKLSEADLSIAIRRLHIRYLSLAVWGETLNISTHLINVRETGAARYVSMTHADGSPVAECLVDWDLVDRPRREARPLPTEFHG
jgi:YbgC/YbaW family acyl-CoA thioester hydrolase